VGKREQCEEGQAEKRGQAGEGADLFDHPDQEAARGYSS
jgi:hypothetical protein